MRLNQTIAYHLSAAELTELGAELGAAGYVRDDAPPDARAADLLAALAATGRAAAVTAALAARRPDVDWAALPWPPAALPPSTLPSTAALTVTGCATSACALASITTTCPARASAPASASWCWQWSGRDERPNSVTRYEWRVTSQK